MRSRLLSQGCTATWWRINGAGLAGVGTFAAHQFGLLPWPALIAAGIGIAISTWWTALAWAHDGWVRGWWWVDTAHRCPGDDGPDEPQPDPQPDGPHHRETYTLAA